MRRKPRPIFTLERTGTCISFASQIAPTWKDSSGPSSAWVVVDHFDDRQRFPVGERDGDALDFDVAFEAVERDAGESGTHFVAGKACGARGGFDGGENQRAQAAARVCRGHKDGADFGGIRGGVEQIRFADGSAIGAEQVLRLDHPPHPARPWRAFASWLNVSATK